MLIGTKLGFFEPSGAGAWGNVSGASYDSKSFNTTTEVVNAQGIYFKDDGTKLYALDNGGTDDIYQYSLSTAWDVSTASYDSKTVSVTSQDTSPLTMFIKPDGTKLYVGGSTNDFIYQYTMSTPWDISTASYDSKSFSLSGESVSTARGLNFKPDGTKMYLIDASSDNIYQYSLSTPWDVSTASYDSKSFNTTTEDGSMSGFQLHPDGNQMIIAGFANDKVYKYTLSTPWDISTASYDSDSFDISGQSLVGLDLYVVADGSKFYVYDNTEFVFQYSF